jgi:hypothetical protein
MKFEVGDKVRIVNGSGYSRKDNGKVIDIYKIEDDAYFCSEKQRYELNLHIDSYWEKELELVESNKENYVNGFFGLDEHLENREYIAYLSALGVTTKTYEFNNGGNNMNKEDIKNYNTQNLKEAKKQVLEEKASEEVQKAKAYFKELIDAKEHYERQIKRTKEELEKVIEEIKIFDKK